MILDGLDEVAPNSNYELGYEKLIANELVFSVFLTSRTGLGDLLNLRLARRGCRRFRIRELSSNELKSVIEAHLNDQNLANEIIERAELGQLPSLRSAMTALMAIRVVNTQADWRSLTKFELYKRYVESLHQYFNAPSVKGSKGQCSVGFKDLLDTLALASEICSDSRVKSNAISLNELYKILESRDPVAAKSLFNCGLLSSDNGQAVFIHKSFEEFGLAIRNETEV